MPPKQFKSVEKSGLPFGIEYYNIPKKMVLDNKYVDVFTKKGNIRKIKGVPAVNFNVDIQKYQRDYVFGDNKKVQEVIILFKKYDDEIELIKQKLEEGNKKHKNFENYKIFRELKREIENINDKYFDIRDYDNKTLKGIYLEKIFNIFENENTDRILIPHFIYENIFDVFDKKYKSGGAFAWGVNLPLKDENFIYKNKNLNPLTKTGNLKTRNKQKVIGIKQKDNLNIYPFKINRPSGFGHIMYVVSFEAKKKVIEKLVKYFDDKEKIYYLLDKKIKEIENKLENEEDNPNKFLRTNTNIYKLWIKTLDTMRNELDELRNKKIDLKKSIELYFKFPPMEEYIGYKNLNYIFGSILYLLFNLKGNIPYEKLYELFKNKYMSGETKKIENIKKVDKIEIAVPQKINVKSLEEKTSILIKEIKNNFNDNNIKKIIDDAHSKLFLENFFKEEKSNLLKEIKKLNRYKDIDTEYLNKEIDNIIQDLTNKRYKEFDKIKGSSKGIVNNPYLKSKTQPNKLMQGVIINGDVL